MDYQNNTGDIHPVFLFFKDKETEKQYRFSLVERDRVQIRIVFVLFILLYALFGVLDMRLAPDFVKLFFKIRFFIVIPVLLLTILFTFSKKFSRFYQLCLFLSFIVSGLGIVIMLIMHPENITYYGGLFLIFYSGFFLLQLRFFYAVIASWIVFAAFFIGINIFGSLDDLSVLVGMNLFYFSSILIGMFGSYSIEQFSRKNYIQKNRIEHDKLMLEKRVLTQTNEIMTAQVVTIYGLAKLVESRDKETGLHVERVGKFCRLIAQALPDNLICETNMSVEEFSDVIEFASALHDIGKVGIADTILNKTAALSKAEFEKIKQHTLIGSETLLNVQNRYPNNKFINMGIEITRSHHERFDGEGYPDGLQGKNIPLAARIMAVADVYDALRSNRPYKRAYSHQKAVEIIKQETGTHFDPRVVTVFLQQEKLFESLSESLS